MSAEDGDRDGSPPRRKRRRRFRRWRELAAILAALNMLVSVYLFTEVRDKAAAGERETVARRSDNCAVFEGQHLQEVKGLRDTYEYLTAVPRRRWDSTRRFVYETTLPRLEAEARDDEDLDGAQVPHYCDMPGLGRPEPDPVVPDRPLELGGAPGPSNPDDRPR